MSDTSTTIVYLQTRIVPKHNGVLKNLVGPNRVT